MQCKSNPARLLLLFILLSFNARADFTEIVVFGDSLSDTGNLASVNNGFPNPPFYAGSRVSNGPVAVEGLAEKMGLSAEPSLHLVAGSGGGNFAVAGARAGGSEPIDLAMQVGAYLLQVGGIASAETLYVMFIGGNDVRDARDVPHSEAKIILSAATDVIDQQLRTIIAAGAQHIMVVNAPDIGRIPETSLLAAQIGNKHLARKASRRSEMFNRQLHRIVRQIEHDSGLDLVLFDLDAYLEKILNNAYAYGFSNTQDACFSTQTFVFNPDCESGQRFDQHLFFDEIHPSARSHERLSRALYAEVPQGD